MQTIDFQNHSFKKVFLGYDFREVESFLNELQIYCWNLEEENKVLTNDLLSLTLHSGLSNETQTLKHLLISKEFSLLLGRVLSEDLLNLDHHLVLSAGSLVTSEIIEEMITKGLYGELVAVCDTHKGVDKND